MNKRKRVECIIILMLTVAAMLCIWPFCLVRRTTEIASRAGAEFIGTEATLQKGCELEQIFVAQEKVLHRMSFSVGYEGTLPENGSLHFALKEAESGKALVEKDIPFAEVENLGLCDVEVEKNLKKGKEYCYVVTVPDEYAGLIKGAYTSEPGQEPAGHIRLSLNGEVIAGQGAARYEYGFPLNAKNVACIWAFLLVIGLTLLQKCGVKLPEGKKLNDWLDRFGTALLAVTVLGTTALIVRICFNEGVHWDEAFTWQLITRNGIQGIIEGTAADVHPPLYYLVAKVAITLFGKNIFVVKMVSVGTAVGSMLLCAILLRKRFGIKPALLMIPIVGLGPQFIHYNVDCRMYSMMIFFVFGAALLAYEIVQDDKAVHWVLFTLFALGGVYTQYFAVVPLVLIYFWLLAQLLKENRRKWIKWLLCCVATVVGYLPWLGVVIGLMKSESVGGADQITFRFSEFLQGLFQTNIEYSAYMPFILFLLCVFVLAFDWKRYGRKEKGFLLLSGSLLWAVELLCVLLAQRMNHFWTERYIVDAIVFVWIFIAVILSRQGNVIWVLTGVWTIVTVLSSYTITKATELNTIPWTTNAREVFAEAQEESVILYNFPTFDVLYEYYLPNAEFVWMDDVDFSRLNQDYVYMICWGGQDFCGEIREQWDISEEYLGTVRLEAGMAGIDFVKVHFEKR